MPEPSLPPEVREILETLHSDMTRAWDQIKSEEARLIRQWPGQDRPVRIQRLRDMAINVRDVMGRVEDAMREPSVKALVSAYETGAWGTALQSGAAATFSALDIDALSVLANDTMSDLLTATKGVDDSTKALIREMSRDRVLNATYAGMTAEQAGVQLAADLAEHAITSVVYVNGARVGLPTYTDMVLRTKSALAFQEGGFQQGKELGIQWWEILDGPECGLSFHEDPTLADGLIVDTTTAEKFPISHPNCVRVTTPRPDINSATEAKNAKRTPTEQQIEDQAQASRARAAALARNPRKVTLTNQVNRELGLRSSDVRLPRPISAAEQRQAARLTRANTQGAVTPQLSPSAARSGYGDISIPLEDLLAPTRDGVKGSAAKYLRPDGTFTPARQALHDKIVLDATRDIPSATGTPTYTMLGGGPASGKTTVIKSGVTDVRDTKSAVHINADELKELLPEVPKMQAKGDGTWAAFSHEESSYLAKRIQAAALERRQHVVLDGTGDSTVKSVVSKIEKAREAGYKVNGVYVSIDTESAVARSTARGLRTGRIVPESVIREVHAGVSDVYPKVAHLFDSTQLVNNEINPTVIAKGLRGQPLTIVDEKAWKEFLAKAGPDARKGYGDIDIPLDDLLAPTRDGVQGSAARHLRADGTFTPERQGLHDKIVRDAIENIPEATDQPTYTMLGGGPASGKTTVIKSGVTDVRDTKAAVHINADELKELLPEVVRMQELGDGTWASFSHEESSYLAKRIQAAAIESRRHVVLDGTGDSTAKSVMSKIDKAREAGYRVDGVYVSIDTEEAVARSAARGLRTGRVVPESIIREVHAGVSEVYPQVAHLFDTTQLVNNQVNPTVIARGLRGQPLTVMDEAAWQEFLAKALA